MKPKLEQILHGIGTTIVAGAFAIGALTFSPQVYATQKKAAKSSYSQVQKQKEKENLEDKLKLQSWCNNVSSNLKNGEFTSESIEWIGKYKSEHDISKDPYYNRIFQVYKDVVYKQYIDAKDKIKNKKLFMNECYKIDAKFKEETKKIFEEPAAPAAPATKNKKTGKKTSRFDYLELEIKRVLAKAEEINNGDTFPLPWFPDVEEASFRTGIDSYKIYAVLHHESAGTFDPNIKGPCKEIGLGQLTEALYNDFRRKYKNLPPANIGRKNPKISIELTAEKLQENIKRDKRWDIALTGYNQGDITFLKVKKYGGDKYLNMLKNSKNPKKRAVYYYHIRVENLEVPYGIIIYDFEQKQMLKEIKPANSTL